MPTELEWPRRCGCGSHCASRVHPKISFQIMCFSVPEREQRGKSYSQKTFKKRKKILEFLCGTGQSSNSTQLSTLLIFMKSDRWLSRNRILLCLRLATAGTFVCTAAAMAFVAAKPSGPLVAKSDGKGDAKFAAKSVRSNAFASHLRTLHRDLFETSLGKLSVSGEPEASRIHNGRAQEAYDNRAYPKKWIDATQQVAAANAANAIANLAPALPTSWQELGPSGVPADDLVASESTGATAGTIYSGRATAIAVDPNCIPSSCTVFIGAAGGGVWKTTNATAATPSWSQVSDGVSGIPSNAIGSIVFDPNDGTGNTLYVGTGEPNGSGDSEAGVGLYKSTNGGLSWTLVAGSTAVATGRSIGAIAIDPANASHIFIGTDVARHGSSSSNGGRFTPPGAPPVGHYESTNGGTSFSSALILTQDAVSPGTPTGGDFFRGGCSHIELYRPASETQVYASFFDYGVFRRRAADVGAPVGVGFHQIFASAGGGLIANSSSSRTEFSLAPNGSNLRIYVGDAQPPASFWRVNNANVTVASLFTSGTNGGWTKLSNPANGTSGFASYNYCSTQCSYDMPVYSPPGFPDIVYIGSSMQYSEIGGRSNGRAIQRSEDAGVNFTDMTIDTNGVSLHPDQHAIASVPGNPNIAFIANDGGIWGLDGSFTDVSSQCSGRGLSGNNLIDCTSWLSKVPTTIFTMNDGLGTLQYQSLSVNVNNPLNEIMGGTQDNGTHAFNTGSWFVTIFGDGGQSGINAFNADKRFHTFFDAQIDMTFRGASPTFASETGWNWVSDTFFSGAGAGEARSFYIPVIYDPVVDGTAFTGLQHVWRTQDDNGGQTFLESNCNEFFGTFTSPCGDWVAIGVDLSTANGNDKGPGQYIVATERAPSDNGTLWVGLRRGRVFISSNADNPDPKKVSFYRIDTKSTPTRFVSGIAVDPSNPNHAFISFSGYNAYNPTQPGHVFEVTYQPFGKSHTATWKNIDHNLGDEPITDIALDSNGDLYVSTDFGVNMLPFLGSTWAPAGAGLPPVATYGLTIDRASRSLYAATHGRGAWRLILP